jgi:predicted KAP-like P-loop ATPase
MWADADAQIDYLNFSEVAELAAELVGTERLLPLSLGIFGTWGTGKSTILNLMRKELSTQSDKFLFVEFDAWLHQDYDDARAALMSVIAKALLDEAPEGLRQKALSLFKRTNKLRILGYAAEGAAAAWGVPTFGLIRKGVEGLGDILSGDADEEDVKAVEAGFKDATKKTDGLISPKVEKSPPEEIEAFRREFGEVLSGLGKTLVVLIDNIDRCTPPNTIHTLEAIRLFLFLPRTAFVIAADEDMVRHAVATHFNNPSQRLVEDYLDKLIQVPIRVPKLGVQEVRAYMLLLFAEAAGADAGRLEDLRAFLIDQLRQAWKPDAKFGVAEALAILKPTDPVALGTTLELADRMAPLLAYSSKVNGNPRIIKRMLNVVRMRASVARKRKMELDESVIAKLALFERCTDATAVDALHTAINVAGGKLDFLAALEAGYADDKEAVEDCPADIMKHIAFVRDWAAIEPKLSNVDLRPAVYLARETVPLRATAVRMSPAALNAIDVLRKVRTGSSPAARAAIAAIPAAEEQLVMEALIRQMRLDSEWSRPRSDFRGAVMLAETSKDAGKLLSAFVTSLGGTAPRWMSMMINASPAKES